MRCKVIENFTAISSGNINFRKSFGLSTKRSDFLSCDRDSFRNSFYYFVSFNRNREKDICIFAFRLFFNTKLTRAQMIFFEFLIKNFAFNVVALVICLFDFCFNFQYLLVFHFSKVSFILCLQLPVIVALALNSYLLYFFAIAFRK